MLESRFVGDRRVSITSGMPAGPLAMIVPRIASARRCCDTSAARTTP